jgi:hypothetical protein
LHALVTTNQYRPTPAAALVLSPDPMGGALIGAAVELGGLVVAFPRQGESAREALRRLRPTAVVVDCADPSALDDAFIGPAMMTGARLFFVGDAITAERLRHVALRFHVTVIELPRDAGQLTRLQVLLGSPARELPR